MSDKDVIILLAFLIAALASWVIYLLIRNQSIKEDALVTKDVLDYYRGRVGKNELKLLNIKEALDAD
jgi:hypothetical protein